MDTVRRTVYSARSARDDMVERQLVGRGIRDPRLLEAMRRVPREHFVPDFSRGRAYDDAPLPIGAEQTISQPYIVARMIEALGIEPTDRVLDVGAGSGYTTALLGELARDVHAIERLPGLAEAARVRLDELGYRNVEVVAGDGAQGLASRAPFDAILVSAGTDAVPPPLIRQLAVGGRLVIPVGADDGLQRLARIRKVEDERLEEEDLDLVRFVPLIADAREASSANVPLAADPAHAAVRIRDSDEPPSVYPESDEPPSRE